MSKPLFISNSPCGEDLFEGKAQEKISKSIVELINDDTFENKLIGLDGTWGSGKSNVVKIVQEQLKNTHHVYIHDAWGYQEDLQRRAFLEELTDDLCKNNIIEHKKWAKNLKDLLARKRETVTKTIPKLSPGIIIAIIFAAFTPLLKVIADGVDCEYQKILILIFPFLVAIVIWLICSIKRKELIGLTEIFYLYKEKELENKTHVTISENEPSVREFRNWMKDLSSDLKSKKLIIVFDNMDRLPSEKVQILWSSIHTFFSEHSFLKIFVIVTFDREHIKEAFKANDENDENINQFINKTFSVVFRVAPLVLTDWQKFFSLKYHDAFKDFENDEHQITENVFDLMQENITPRKIIAFINESVSIKRVAGTDILMRYVAIFVLAKKKLLVDPINQILSLDFLGGAFNLFKGDSDLPNNIAALVFNVPLESASQVTLTRELEISLRDSNNKRLAQLSDHPYFIEILEQVIHKSGFIYFENITLSVDSLNLDASNAYNKGKLDYLWNTLGGFQLKVKIEEQKISDAQKVIFRKSSSQQLNLQIDNIINQIQNFDEFNGINYFTSLNELEDFINSNKLNIDISSKLKVKHVKPEAFFEYLIAARSNYKKYNLKCEETLINKFLETKLSTDLESFMIFSPLLSVIKEEYKFDGIIKEIEKLIAGGLIDDSNVTTIYSLYKRVSTTKPIKILDDITISNLLVTIPITNEVYFDLVSMRLARGLSFVPVSSLPPLVLNLSDDNLIEKVAERIEYFENYGTLLCNLETNSEPLLISVLNRLTKKSYGVTRLSIELVLPKFEKILNIIGVTPDEFLNKLNSWVGPAKQKITINTIKTLIPDIKFYEYAINNNSELAKFTLEEFVKYLDTVSVSDWTAAFHDELSFLFNTTYWLMFGNKLKNLPDNAVTSYKEILKEIARGKFVMAKLEIWAAFYDKINKNNLKTTIKDIRDIFITEVTITPTEFLYFAQMLKDYGALEKRAADVTRRILTTVANDDTCLTFIINNRKYFVPIINDSGDDAIDFKDIIRQKIDAEPNVDNLKEFANQINLNVEGHQEE